MNKRADEGDYVWSAHLIRQMQRRQVSRGQVLDALSSASLPGVSNTTGSLCYRHTYPDGRTLKVWVKASTHTPRTITSAAWEGEDD
jgi:hypothetical protein